MVVAATDVVDDCVPGQPEQPAPEGNAPLLISRQRFQGLDEDELRQVLRVRRAIDAAGDEAIDRLVVVIEDQPEGPGVPVPGIRHELLDVIAGLRAVQETTILVTTHYLDEADRLCDRVAIIHLGSIVALDSPQALLERVGNEIIEFRVKEDPETVLLRLRARGIAGPDAFAVGAKCHTINAARVTLQRQGLFAGLRIPHLYRIVPAAAHDQFAVGAK